MKPNPNYYFRILFFSAIFFISLTSYGQKNYTRFEEIYKQIDSVKLKMVIYHPENFRQTEKYPTIVFFFGGGWISRSFDQFIPFAIHCASKGMIAVLADYRVGKWEKTTPFESLKDAKSAIRYLRQNAAKLSIDTNMIIASGGSAGGHLAAACFTNETVNEAGEDLNVSSKPNALVLFNAVIDNSKAGYGYERIGERYLEFSPLHNIRKGFPPTVFFLGTKDKLIPVATAETFKQKIEGVGGICTLHLYENQEHGFFNQKVLHADLFSKMNTFFDSIGIKPQI